MFFRLSLWEYGMTEATHNFILLVDDDAVGRSLRKLVLETREHRVLAVGEVDTALRAVQHESICLVILDYFLDGTTGTELARQIRELKPGLPILLLSASCSEPDSMEYVDGYLSKLEPVQTIEEKIASLLERGGSGATQSLCREKPPLPGPC